MLSSSRDLSVLLSAPSSVELMVSHTVVFVSCMLHFFYETEMTVWDNINSTEECAWKSIERSRDELKVEMRFLSEI